jgi:hypothetical protein
VNLKSKLPKKLQKYASFGVFPKILLAPVAFLILLGFSIARLFVHIRLYRMVDTRIGHLALNTEIVRLTQLKNNSNNTKREVTVYCSESRRCANESLRKLFFRKKLHLRGSLAWITLFLASELNVFKSFNTRSNKKLSVDREGLLSDKKFDVLGFSNQELRKAKEFLDSIEVSEKKIVCLNVRDEKYLAVTSRLSRFHYRHLPSGSRNAR